MGNSSSTPSSSTTTNTNTNGEQYDVFISFRGEDTRNGFTSHLYQALHEKQIKTFIDYQLKRGEEISKGLWTAIRESKIYVIIFSENYASSKWCLRELAEIMMKNQIVIPVFYEVDPSHVRKQSESYEAAFAKHENESQQEVKKWREALTQASNISGFDSSKARNESELVCNIVRDVWKKLNNIWPSCNFEDLVKGLVGIEKHITGVVSKLCLEVQDFRIIGIWGMGGMGKTTIADAVFHIISDQFENKTYFLGSVRAESEKDSNRLIHLRKKILSKVLNIENIENQISDSPNIPQHFKKMLLQKKVLIVFDDVDSIKQLETLAGDLDRLSPGSRIIVTTRDKQVLRNCGVKDHNMYEVKGLNDDEARQLFCNHAFKHGQPIEDFDDLPGEVVKIATNLPLAVKVLGSLLYKKSKKDWESAIEKFKRNVNSKVLDVLKISYDGLDEEEKGLFLDIACFVPFEFEIDEEYLAPNLSSDRGFSLSGLIDKSLVTVECGSIKMHDLLQEMGREIIDKESPNKPGDRSRLWRRNDVLHTLEHNDRTDAVQGIFLIMFKNLKVVRQTLMKMNNLTTLIIKGGMVSRWIHFYGGLDYLPNELRYLHWITYPLKVLPSSFNPVNLVELDLSYNKIKKLWKGSTCVPKLKWLNLYCCVNLISIPDLSNIPSAEIINLKYCHSLIEIHSSRECPKNLHSLQLKGCGSLSRLPSNIHLSEEPSFSTSVVLHSSREGSEFSLSNCFRLTKFPHISGNIKSLDLSGSGVEEVPSTIESLSKLECLNMVWCISLKRISESICKLKSLDRLDLTNCLKLESFPDILEGMELKYLDLSGTAIKEPPPSIENLNQLEELVLSGCNTLETFPSSICKLKSLVRLDLSGCYRNFGAMQIKDLSLSIGNLNGLDELVLSRYLIYERSKLEKLPHLSGLCSLKKLRLIYSNLTEISEDIGCLSSLEMLELDGNVFERLPKSIKQLSKLYYLSLNHCGMLQSLPELPSSLRYLGAMHCKELFQSLPDESKFELCPDGSGSFYFNFLNSLKLNQKAISNLLIFFQDSLQKMQGKGTEKIVSLFKVSLEVTSQLPPNHLHLLLTPDEEVKGTIYLPGSKIPDWFCHQNIGSSINNIPVLRNDCARSRYTMGFEVCLVIGAAKYNDDLKYALASSIDVCYDFHIETSDGHKEGFFRNSFQLSGRPFRGSDHILLGYNLSRKCYEFFQELDTRLTNRGISDYVGTSFKFNIRIKDRRGDYQHLPPGCEVKYCGIQPIYVPFIDFVSINQDTGDISGRKDIAEEKMRTTS